VSPTRARASLLPRATGGVAALLVATAGLATGESGAPPPCSATVTLEPDRAVPGQQVLYRVEISSPEGVAGVTWVEPPSFPALRSERLPGTSQPGRVAQEAASQRSQEERFALFPERTGLLVLRGPAVRCTAAGGGEEFPVRVPDIRLLVEPLPEAGRPETFDGLVGPLALRVTVTPHEMRVGDSVRVAAMLRGGGNLWDAGPPFDEASLGDAEVFALRPSLALERGRILRVRRHYGYDVVPRKAGSLIVPAVRVPYFDPESQTYAVASSTEVRVHVAARESASDVEPGGGRVGSSSAALGAHDASRRSPRSRSVVGWLVGLAALAILALAIGFRLWRGHTAGTEEALARAELARRAGDAEGEAAALETALRLALERVVADARATTPEELIAREGTPSRIRRAAQLLAMLERSRFDPATSPPDASAVLQAIDALN
jgi:hypothetical protein